VSATAEQIARALVAAQAARARAYAPYSHFHVGAAVLGADGALHTGANVENASYGLTACAERIAIWTAVVAGAGSIVLVALVTDTLEPVTPCGACRQVLAELAPGAEMIMATVSGRQRRATVAELLPGAFTAGDLTPRPSPAREGS